MKSQMKKVNLSSQRGQIVVEYVLLLTISISIAIIMITALIKRDQDDAENSGAVIRQWNEMQQAVGNDVPN